MYSYVQGLGKTTGFWVLAVYPKCVHSNASAIKEYNEYERKTQCQALAPQMRNRNTVFLGRRVRHRWPLWLVCVDRGHREAGNKLAGTPKGIPPQLVIN